MGHVSNLDMTKTTATSREIPTVTIVFFFKYLTSSCDHRQW